MKGYGSIQPNNETFNLVVDNNEDVDLDGPSTPTRSNLSSTGAMLAIFSVLLVWFSSTTSNNTPHPLLLANGNMDPSWVWGLPKDFIRQVNDPNKELYYTQIVDHDQGLNSGTYRQRYFENLHFWEGPGHPIFMILGGEGPLEHILYPFISEVLAKYYGGVTVNPEHRYFGKSFPKAKPSKEDLRAQMTPKQAMHDFVTFVQAKQAQLGCGPKGTKEYCPVITIGGSYPVSCCCSNKLTKNLAFSDKSSFLNH
jgi:Serine carboxypeptidase S28